MSNTATKARATEEAFDRCISLMSALDDACRLVGTPPGCVGTLQNWEPGMDFPELSEDGWRMIQPAAAIARASWRGIYDTIRELVTTPGSLDYAERVASTAAGALSGLRHDLPIAQAQVTYGLSWVVGDALERMEREYRHHLESTHA